MEFRFDYLADSLKYGFMYLPVTAKLALLSYAVGIALGLVIAIIRNYKIPILTQLFAAFVAVYQGVPAMVALLIYNLLFITCFNDVAAFFHSKLTLADVNAICVGYFTLSLFCIVHVSETFRGALKSIPANQYEAGYSVGLTKIQTLRRIIIPQMIPVAMPGLINNMVGTIKATALVSAVGIVEVMQGSIIPCGITYSYMEGYAAAAIVYWIFSEVIGRMMRLLEKGSNRYTRRGAI